MVYLFLLPSSNQVIALIVYAAGSALPVFNLSLVKSHAVSDDTNTNARDYSIVMLTRTLGTLIGVPLMTLAWAQGIGFGGYAMGLPYFLSAVSQNLVMFPMAGMLIFKMFYACDCFVFRKLDLR